MELLTYLASEPTALIVSVGLLGLIVGSFLNVVIYRLPMMIERDWRVQCLDLLEKTPETTAEPFNLIQPRSRCPHCGHLITALENIPLFSYLWQKGRCTACQQPISWQYPAIELFSAILSMITAWHFGFGWPLLGALIFTWAIIASATIDFKTYYLFDDITLPLLWLGIACNLNGLYIDLTSSVIGAMAGYLSLWSVNTLFKIIRHKEGMGGGDFKFLAMLGAWMGWQALPMIILLSAFVAAAIGLTIMLIKRQDMDLKIPYGPYLAAAGWICFIFELTYQDYLRWATP